MDDRQVDGRQMVHYDNRRLITYYLNEDIKNNLTTKNLQSSQFIYNLISTCIHKYINKKITKYIDQQS